MSFKELSLDQNILKAIQEAGYTSPTPIQVQAIPEVLRGSDLRASAQTGTGKTAAFILPSLHRLSVASPHSSKGPRVLILVPTRELAMQVTTEAHKYSKYLSRCKTICIYGGAPYPPQNRDLARPHEILVATPGRLIDHMEQKRVDFSRVEMLILDEADRMLDMGFINPVEMIAEALPKKRQTLMFSATFSGSVLKLSNRLLTDPVEIRISPERIHHEKIEQRLHPVDNLEHKYLLLDHLLKDPALTQAIVFTATQRQADHLVEKLTHFGCSAKALHGGMSQRHRTRTIREMREEEFNILVATDVASRGIDIQTISHVINFDLPRNTEDYIHRIGRTGRAGASGIALSFATHKEMSLVRQIEKLMGKRIASHPVPGLEPKRSASEAPFKPRRFPEKKNKGRPNQYKSKPRRWYP